MIDAPPSGHIKVSRKVFDELHGDPLWLETREFSRWEAWIDVIQTAAWRKSSFATAGGVIPLERGEFVASRRHLAKRWHWTEKKVRVWFEMVKKGARLRAQRETHAGTVYLIVKYDAYQANPSADGQGKGPAEGQARAQQGPKIEAVKAVKAVRPKKLPDAGASARNLEVFPEGTCSAGFERWVSKIGAVHYGRFRNALLPLYQAKPRCYTGEQLAAAVDAFYDGKLGDDARFQGKWTVNRFASELHQWVRLGAMEYVDDFGLPTERGTVARIFAS